MERSTGCPGVDRISELPDDVLRLILTLMPLSDAGVTTTLAKRWRSLFHEIPDIRIDYDSFDEEGPLGPFEFSDGTWFAALAGILFHRRAPFRKCVIDVTRIWYTNDLIWMIIFICSLGVEDLTLDGDELDLFDVPNAVLACDSLYRLDLSNCKLVVPPEVMGLYHLKTLILTNVRLSDDHVERLVSQCPYLEELQLYYCPSMISKVVICSTSLLALKVICYWKVRLFVEKASCLSNVRIDVDNYNLDVDDYDDDDEDDAENNYDDEVIEEVNDEDDEGMVVQQEEEEVVQQEGEVVVKQGGQVRWFLEILQSLSESRIKSLALSFQYQTMQELMEDKVPLPEKSPHKLLHLKKLRLEMPFSKGFSVLSCLLNSSPNVEELIIDELWWGGITRPVEEDYWDHSKVLECTANWPMHTTLFVRFERLEHWIGFIRLVVIHAYALKKMTVNCRCVPNEKTKGKVALEKARRELLRLQQVFPHVTLEVTPVGRFW